MKIAVIGGSGFVGTRLIELLRQDHEVLNIDKSPSLFFPDLTKIGDIRNEEQLRPLLQGQDAVVLLAAEHRDDVSPVSLYYDVNVEGTKKVLKVMDDCGISQILFTSSVAVYGLDKNCPVESSPVDPFNHYGKSKFAAEEALRQWHSVSPKSRSLTILRPTVIFGERNRGNVYNLLKQIAKGPFLMVGKGNNYKSMAYVGNIVALIQLLVANGKPGSQLFNYADKPDLSTSDLVRSVGAVLGRKLSTIRIPYAIGMLGGLGFDFLALLTRKKFPISSIRVKKFCATTQFASENLAASGFHPPFTLAEGLKRTLEYEFTDLVQSDDRVFYSE